MRKLLNAFFYSCAGLRATFQSERAFRQEVALLILLFPLGLWLGHTGVERALLVGSLLLVLMAELVNTALECVVNRISTEHHPLSGKAKDVGSAVVLLALFNAGLVWLLVLMG